MDREKLQSAYKSALGAGLAGTERAMEKDYANAETFYRQAIQKYTSVIDELAGLPGKDNDLKKIYDSSVRFRDRLQRELDLLARIKEIREVIKSVQV
jgi:hypothetical protein